MYWFHAVAKQPRIIAQDTFGRYFSIPEDYEHDVVPLDDEGQGRLGLLSLNHKPINVHWLMIFTPRDFFSCQYWFLNLLPIFFL